MWKRKFKVFFLDHWIKVAVVVFLAGAIWIPWTVLSLIDSYQRIYMLAWLSIMPIQAVLHSAIFVILLYWLHYGGGFSKLKKKKVDAEEVSIHWDDVIGMEQAKMEAAEVVKLLKDHARVKKIGGKMLRGLLMMGPPGCGKTYLAKAIATEAGMPFLSMSASEFVEMFVGVGASRIRQIFKKARRLAYGAGGCIIFIDEVDSIARKRSFNQFGGQETDNTQNQLLAEMDGLGNATDNVVVMAATNAPENTMDEALMRPGRFDRKIHVQRPDAVEREAIFKYYMSKVKFDPSVDMGRLARKAIRKTPSDINNIVQEAALISSRESKDAIDYKDLADAMDRIDLGFKHRLKMTPREKSMTAYHETGHAVILYYTHPDLDVNYATIISRKGSLGHVQHIDVEELYSRDRDSFLATIKMYLAGYVAERIKFGVTTSGVSQDFRNAMKYAHDMVWSVGMGETGLVGDYSMIPETQLSDDIKTTLNKQTQKILDACLKEVEEVLIREDKVFEEFTRQLIQKEELDFEQIAEIFEKFGTKAKRKLRPATQPKEGSIGE